MKKSLMMKILGVAAVVMMLSLVIATPASAKHHRPDREVPIKGTVTGERRGQPSAGPRRLGVHQHRNGADVPPRQGRLLPDAELELRS